MDDTVSVQVVMVNYYQMVSLIIKCECLEDATPTVVS